MDRVILVARYSGDDEAGAMDRQRQLLGAWVAEDPTRVMASGPSGGWIEDETVSGSVNLDQRKSLGQWMRDPLLHEWDTMVVTEQDRVTRDDIHWWTFVGRLIEWGKRLVVLDDPGLDLTTPNGRMIAGVKAAQAANYRADVQRKARKAREAFREQRRFGGGHWPFGYRAVPRDGQEGWHLIVDPDSSAWVREAVDRVLAEPGESLREVVRDWIARGIPTAREHQARQTPPKPGVAPREPRSYTWDVSSLKRILLSPTLLGYGTHRGEIIREDGLPVKFADPIITPDEALKLREKITDRGAFRRGIRANRSPLLGVVYCECGRPMHYVRSRPGRDRGRVYEYYRCSAIVRDGDRCPIDGRSWPIETVKAVLEEHFLGELGDEEIKNRKFIPGTNREPEIASLKEAIDHLSGNLGNLPAGSRAAQAAISKLGELESALDDLEAQPVTPAREVYTGTGKTFGQWWADTRDWGDRGVFLMRAGIWLSLGGLPRAPRVHLHWPAGLLDRASAATTPSG